MKKILLTIFALSLFLSASAQWGEDEMDDKPSFRDRVFTGGGFGFSFSSYVTNISVSPIVGYKITEKLATGLQIQYQYNKYKEVDISTSNYGLSPFVRYNFYGPLFAHAEYEYLNYVYAINPQTKKKERDSFNSFMLGGGYFQPLGSKAGFFLLALYNLSYKTPEANDPRIQPYDSPWVIRAGITAGF